MVREGGVGEDGHKGGVEGVKAQGCGKVVHAGCRRKGFPAKDHIQNNSAEFCPGGRYGAFPQDMRGVISIICHPLAAVFPDEPEVGVAFPGGGIFKAYPAVQTDDSHAGQDVFYIQSPGP